VSEGAAAAPPPAVTRPIPGLLLRLALPVLASQLLRLSYQWVDAIWVKSLGVSATAAVTSSVFVMWLVYSLNDIFSIGVTAYVSQLVGAGERERAGVAARMGLTASFLLGLVGTLGSFWAHDIYRVMGTAPDVIEQGGSYLRIVLAAAPLPMMGLTCESIMRASGDTRSPMLIDLAAVSLNAVLAPLLIFGIGPFPRLGVAGAALATVIAQAVMVTCFLTLAARGHRAFPLRRRAPGAPVQIFGMARVGLPASLIGALFSVAYVAFTRSASRFGPGAMAIVGIVNRIEALDFVVAISIGAAGASLVGQNLGAGREDRAVSVVRTALWWSGTITFVLTLIYFIFPAPMLALFSRDPDVIRMGVPYMRVLALSVMATGLELTTAESLLGSGHTREMSIIYSVFSLIRVPLAFWVPDWTGTGVVGIAWLITVTCILRTALILTWAARGTWKRGLHRELGPE
jgi:putative MATE family efflux protein